MPPCRETLWKAVDGWIPSVTLCSGRRIHHQQPIVAWETVPGFRSMFSLRRGTEASPPRQPGEGGISTVALLMESDGVGGRRDVPISVISTRALLTESDYGRSGSGKSRSLFQSTLSSRRATPQHPVRPAPSGISIHALLTESDAHSATREITCEKFQSTLSSRRATLPRNTVLSWMNYFNPRSPHGERPDTLSSSRVEKKFQSTLSSRRATAWLFGGRTGRSISIHALLTESDSTRSAMPLTTDYFNPRSPHGERPQTGRAGWPGCYFNPRSPHGERRMCLQSRMLSRVISIHALLTESDKSERLDMIPLSDFNPRSPHGERLTIFMRHLTKC